MVVGETGRAFAVLVEERQVLAAASNNPIVIAGQRRSASVALGHISRQAKMALNKKSLPLACVFKCSLNTAHVDLDISQTGLDTSHTGLDSQALLFSETRLWLFFLGSQLGNPTILAIELWVQYYKCWIQTKRVLILKFLKLKVGLSSNLYYRVRSCSGPSVEGRNWFFDCI